MPDPDFSLVLVSVYDTFHPHLTALCMPLPFGLQLSVLSSPLLLESSPRLLFAVATTVCLCFGFIYFNLLGPNNISRPEVRKARKRVNGKSLDVATGKLQIVTQKEKKGGFIPCFKSGCCLLFCMHTRTGGGVLLFRLQHESLLRACRRKLSLSRTHAHIYAPHNFLWFARI